MNYIHPIGNRYRLVARNEGKIKSYASCNDIRAWSHDVGTRDRYLREWMKCDMSICIIPVHILTSFLRNITCRSKRKATPKCHPDCKSKVLLETICSSCQVMKECLKNDSNFEKYFEEEEFETCHWPCERCLDVLKSIKMFWKIIVEKIFNVDYKSEDVYSGHGSRTDCIQSVAKVWEKEIIEQALFLKNINPFPIKRPSINNNCNVQKQLEANIESSSRIPIHCKTERESVHQNKLVNSKNNVTKIETKLSELVINESNKSNGKEVRRKLSRCTSVRIKVANKGCDVCNLEKDNDEIRAYKRNLEFLQQRYIRQENEMETLKRENTSLKLELQNFYKTCSWKSSFYTTGDIPSDNSVDGVVLKPFENVEENKNENIVKEFDSEMIITMRNLHNTFGELVKREMTIVNKNNNNTEAAQIDASFRRVKGSKSVPSSPILSDSASALSNFVSL
ncbi:uncharacterized protein ACR2FA_003192 [Aphomia sociella]